MPKNIPNKGDRVSVPVLTGYIPNQNRPRDCYHGCTCGKCNGVTTVYEGTVDHVTYWMDNSVESTVICDDGFTRTLRHVGPHGDVCY